MQKLTTQLLIAAGVALTIGVFFWQADQSQPGIAELDDQSTSVVSITPDNQDLGTVIYGDVPETDFWITNDTDQVINLTRVSTSCGCTKAFPEKDVLQPGESMKMKVTFDPAVHGDATDVGELTRTIYVQTDHPNFSKFENTITATVVK